MDMLVEGIDFLVFWDQHTSGSRVQVYKGIQSPLKQLQSKFGQMRNVQSQLQRRFLAQVPGTIGDFGSLVTHAFKVLGNLHRYSDEPEVGGQRSFGQESNRGFVHLDFIMVNDFVVSADAQGKVVIAVDQR